MIHNGSWGNNIRSTCDEGDDGRIDESVAAVGGPNHDARSRNQHLTPVRSKRETERGREKKEVTVRTFADVVDHGCSYSDHSTCTCMALCSSQHQQLCPDLLFVNQPAPTAHLILAQLYA